MNTCKELKRSMLGEAVEIREDIAGFYEARRAADREAGKRSTDPMLLAWFDRRSGDFSPRVE